MMHGDFKSRYRCTIDLLKKIEEDVNKRDWGKKADILEKVRSDKTKLESILSSYRILTVF